MNENLFKNYGVEIDLEYDDDFNIVVETLTRMGIASYKNKTLTQSCHIFHRQGRYAIMHFKEMLAFDGKNVDIDESDIARRNLIVSRLNEWELIKPKGDFSTPMADKTALKIISSAEKPKWSLMSKYTIGKK